MQSSSFVTGGIGIKFTELARGELISVFLQNSDIINFLDVANQVRETVETVE